MADNAAQHADCVRDEHGCFVGHPGRECGEHRTTGDRAWCFDCSEWCYPSMPCARCELPVLRKVAADLAEALRFHEDRRINPTSRGGPALAAYAALIDGGEGA
jgi:hypothetical protein